MTLEQLRNEFSLGDLSCRSQSWNFAGNVLIIYIYISSKQVGNIYTKLRKNGSLDVVQIDPVVDQKGSQLLVAIAEREKIPQKVLTKAILKQIHDLPWP